MALGKADKNYIKKMALGKAISDKDYWYVLRHI